VIWGEVKCAMAKQAKEYDVVLTDDLNKVRKLLEIGYEYVFIRGRTVVLRKTVTPEGV
jgi:hypothetical protein